MIGLINISIELWCTFLNFKSFYDFIFCIFNDFYKALYSHTKLCGWIHKLKSVQIAFRLEMTHTLISKNKMRSFDTAFQSPIFGRKPRILNSCFWLAAYRKYFFLWTAYRPISAQAHNKDGLITSMAVSINLKLERCASSRYVGFFCLWNLTKMISCVNLCGMKYGKIWVQWPDISFVAQGKRDKITGMCKLCRKKVVFALVLLKRRATENQWKALICA